MYNFLQWVYEMFLYLGEGVLLAAGVLLVVILIEARGHKGDRGDKNERV